MPACHRPMLALLSTAAFAAAAQEAPPSAPPSGWTGTGELGLALARGNARSETLNGKLALGKETASWKHDWQASVLRAKGEVTGDFDGDGGEEERYELTANRYELAASSAYKFDERNYLVGAGRYENDDFAPYDYQGTFSLGYGHVFIRDEATSLAIDIGPGWRRARDAETGQPDSGMVVRGKLDFSRQLTPNTRLFDTLLVESGSDNTFAQNDIGVSVAMNEAFALKAGYQARYNSEVEQGGGVRHTDTLTTINLVYSFR